MREQRVVTAWLAGVVAVCGLAASPAQALVADRVTAIGNSGPTAGTVVNVVTTGATVAGAGILVAVAHNTNPAPAVTVTDTAGNTYVQRGTDARSNTVTNIVRTELWATYAATSLPLGSTITVTFASAVGEALVSIVQVPGVFQTSAVTGGMLDIGVSNSANNTVAQAPVTAAITQTADAEEFVILGTSGTGAPTLAPLGSFVSAAANVGTTRRLDVFRRRLDRRGNENASCGSAGATSPCRFVGGLGATRGWALLAVSIRYAPSVIVVTAPASWPGSPPSCQTVTVETRNDNNEPVAPAGAGGTSTVIQLTSDSSTEAFYTDGSTCAGAAADTLSFTQPPVNTAATTTRAHEIQDISAGTYVLTASRQTGPAGEVLTDGTTGYAVTGAGATQYLVAIEGIQTFTNGVGLVPASPPSLPVGTFSVVVYAVDAANNLDLAYDSTVPNFVPFVDLDFTDTYAGGCDVPTYNGVVSPTPVSVLFIEGVSESVFVTVNSAGQLTVTATEVSADLGTGYAYPLAGTTPTLDFISNDTTGSAATINSPVPVARSNGRVTVSFVNSTSNPITSVTLERPDNTWSWFSSTNTCGLTPTVTASTITFSGPLAAGTPCTITGINTGNLYPNYGVTTNLTTDFNWSSCAGTPGPAGLPLQARIPVGPPLNPGVTRMQGRASTVAFWSDSNVNQTAAGTLVLRTPNGTIPALPADKTVYGVGNILAPNSTVVCVAAAGAQTCTDANAGVLGSTSQYTLHQFDSANIYSRVAGTGLLVTAFPQPASAGGWFYARESFVSLAEPGVRPSNVGAPTSGFVAVPSNDLGVYMVRLNDASEQRRASRSTNAIQRRVNPAVGTAFAGDIGPDGNLYAIPTSGTGNGTIVSASQTHLPTGLPVTGGVNQVLRASLPAAAQANYATDVMVFGTNSGSGGNFIQATPPSLGAPYWNFATGADQVTHEPYMDYARGFLFVPVGVGNGILVFDLNVAGTPPGPGVYAANLTAQKLLNTRTFQAQCRKQQTGNVLFCGATNGDVVAIDLTNGNTLGTTNVGGSVQSISTLASSFNGDIIYTTRSGTIGRLNFAAGTFTGVWGPSTITGATVLSPATSVGSGLYVGANGPTTARLFKLNIGNGSVLDNRSLVSTGAVGAVGVDAFQNRLAATTAAGTIWSFPTF